MAHEPSLGPCGAICKGFRHRNHYMLVPDEPARHGWDFAVRTITKPVPQSCKLEPNGLK